MIGPKSVAVYEMIVRREVVYIGSSANPDRRFYQHRKKCGFEIWPEINVVSWCRNRAAARRLEAKLIRQKQPPLNVQYTGRRERLAWRPRTIEECYDPQRPMQE